MPVSVKGKTLGDAQRHLGGLGETHVSVGVVVAVVAVALGSQVRLPATGATRVRSWLLNSPDRWQTRSLRRSVAPIVGVVLALSFMGVGIGLAVRSSARISSYVVVWVRPGASVAQREAILRELRSTDGVIACYYWSQLLDYRQAKTLLPTNISGDVSPKVTPASIRCAAGSQRVPREVFATWVGKPGVYSVTPGYPAGGLTPP